MDRRRRAYPTFADLRAYCSLAADPMGEMVLQVFGTATPDRVELSDRICTGLRLVRHVRDVTADYHRGRVYLPVEDLDRFGVRPDQLADGPPAPEVRDLLAFQAERASAWLEAGAPLVATLQGWPRLAVSGYLAGARAALDVLARSGYDPLGGLPAPRRRAVVGQWLLASLRSTG
jgi:phytoene/squalene synthetase